MSLLYAQLKSPPDKELSSQYEEFNWIEDSSNDRREIKVSSQKRKGFLSVCSCCWPFLPRPIRSLLHVFLITLLCLLPGAVDYLIYSVIIRNQSLEEFPSQSKTTIGSYSLWFWSLCAAVSYLVYKLCHVLVESALELVMRFVRFVYGFVPAKIDLYADYVRDLSWYVGTLIFVIVIEVALSVTFKPEVYNQGPDQWRSILFRVWSSLLAYMLYMTVEKFSVQIIATRFHRQAYLDRIRQANYESQIVNTLSMESKKILRDKQQLQQTLQSAQQPDQVFSDRSNSPIKSWLIKKPKYHKDDSTLNVRSEASLNGDKNQLSIQEHHKRAKSASQDLLSHIGETPLSNKSREPAINNKTLRHTSSDISLRRKSMLSKLWNSNVSQKPDQQHNNEGHQNLERRKSQVSISLESLEPKKHGHHRFLRLAKELGKGISNAYESGRVAKRIFEALSSDTLEFMSVHSKKFVTKPLTLKIENISDRNNLYLENFEPYFASREDAEKAFSVFDKDGNGSISKVEMRDTVVALYKERKELSSSLRDVGQAVGKLDTVLSILVYLIWFLTTLLIFGVALGSYLVTTVSLLFAATFIFGNSAKNMFEGIVFMFVTHPFDTGDRIFVDGNNFIVKELGILYTVLQKWDGQLIYSPNSVLAMKEITNVRRSPNQIEVFELQVAFSTPRAVLTQLQSRLNEYLLAEESREVVPKIELLPYEIGHMNVLKLQIYLEHKSNWFDMGKRFGRRGRFLLHLKQYLEELQITYRPITQPIRVHKQQQ